jgi:hypothetical protein
MSEADEVERRARASLAGPVAKTLEIQAAIHLAALRAREIGMDAEAWALACGESWRALEDVWRRVEGRLSAGLASGPNLPILAEIVALARNNLIAHVDSCEACKHGVLEHTTTCRGCVLASGPTRIEPVPGAHVQGAGGCANYRELSQAYEGALKVHERRA